MSTTLQDLKYGESACCGAELYMGDICSDCKEHSGPAEYDCELCEDTGVITKTEWTGTDDSYEVEKKCVCQMD